MIYSQHGGIYLCRSMSRSSNGLAVNRRPYFVPSADFSFSVASLVLSSITCRV